MEITRREVAVVVTEQLNSSRRFSLFKDLSAKLKDKTFGQLNSINIQVNNGKPKLQEHFQESEYSPLQALTTAALVLPGLMAPTVNAAEGDEVDFQYSHYQEGSRNFSGVVVNQDSGGSQLTGLKNALNPIEVDSLHGHSNVSLTDRIKFAFNYTQDTWGGATPIATAPAAFGVNTPLYSDSGTVVGASPLLQGGADVLLDKNFKPVLFNQAFDPTSGFSRNNQLTHVMTMASPETRKQGDFKLTHEWDEAALNLGGGISIERDYESRFGNIGGRWDLNQKRTALNLDLSYTNSDTSAIVNHDTLPYIDIDAYKLGGQVETLPSKADANVIHGNRQDWSTHFGVSQVLNKDALVSADVGYTRSTGYLANPYKAVSVVFIDPTQQAGVPTGVYRGQLRALLEQRPNERNQWNLGGRYVQFINAFDAALHFDYRFSADDWGIQAHTFESDWVQPLGRGWSVTPRVRYYSQDAADFYTPWLVSRQPYNPVFDANGNKIKLAYNPNKLPANFSSDQRLSGFGTLSGGIAVSKQFTKGISLETGFEYYTHKGSFKIGGGGEGSYADIDYWVANAALKINLDALAQNPFGNTDKTAMVHHDHGAPAPAGVMFGHLLPKAGDVMVGYRYMYGDQGSVMLNGDQGVSDQDIVARGCGTNACFVKPSSMAMHMHMLDLMYAPTDWLTLMLMPQFVDMSMSMDALKNTPNPQDTFGASLAQHIVHHVQNGHETGGIGDLGMYALVKLFDQGVHHLHATAGLSAPTGDIDIQLARNHQVDGGFIHYGMQLGSGTWDFKPSLTYTGNIDGFSWGAQTNGTVRMEDHNKSGYALGDIFQATAWGGYNLTHWLTASVRGVYTLQGAIKGQYNGLINQFGPMDYPQNYGGKYWDVGFGLSAVVPSGDLAGNRVSVEWLQPLEDNVKGYQLERDGALSATWSVAF